MSGEPVYGTNDTMQGPLGSNASGAWARVHGVHLVDPGSCRLPRRGTLTLAEWKQQQAASSAMASLSLDPPSTVESVAIGADDGPTTATAPDAAGAVA